MNRITLFDGLAERTARRRNICGRRLSIVLAQTPAENVWRLIDDSFVLTR